jgi:hypothetical protein
MYGESVCQVARSWVDVGSFHTRLVVRFMIFTASVRNILDTPSYLFLFLQLPLLVCHIALYFTSFFLIYTHKMSNKMQH